MLSVPQDREILFRSGANQTSLADVLETARTTAEELIAAENLGAVRGSITALQTGLSDTANRITQLSTSADTRATSLQTDIAAAKSSADSGIASNLALINALTTRLAAAEQAIATLSSRNTDLESTLTATRNRVTSLETGYDRHQKGRPERLIEVLTMRRDFVDLPFIFKPYTRAG